MGRPNSKSGGDGGGDNPHRARPTSGCTRAIEQIDRGEACEQTDDGSDGNEAPVVLNCKAGQDAEHFGMHPDKEVPDDTSEKFMCR
jgi:hypothetical protein